MQDALDPPPAKDSLDIAIACQSAAHHMLSSTLKLQPLTSQLTKSVALGVSPAASNVSLLSSSSTFKKNPAQTQTLIFVLCEHPFDHCYARGGTFAQQFNPLEASPGSSAFALCTLKIVICSRSGSLKQQAVQEYRGPTFQNASRRAARQRIFLGFGKGIVATASTHIRSLQPRSRVSLRGKGSPEHHALVALAVLGVLPRSPQHASRPCARHTVLRTPLREGLPWMKGAGAHYIA